MTAKVKVLPSLAPILFRAINDYEVVLRDGKCCSRLGNLGESSQR